VSVRPLPLAVRQVLYVVRASGTPSAAVACWRQEQSAAHMATKGIPTERVSDLCRPRKNPDAAALAAAKAAKAAGMTIFSVGVKDSAKVQYAWAAVHSEHCFHPSEISHDSGPRTADGSMAGMSQQHAPLTQSCLQLSRSSVPADKGMWQHQQPAATFHGCDCSSIMLQQEIALQTHCMLPCRRQTTP
jgi:hypothetical protein